MSYSVNELNGWSIGQSAYIQLNFDGWPTWYQVTITGLFSDQGGWAETRSSQGGWSCEFFPISSLSHKPSSAKLPDNAVGHCHYCGQPAYGFGFFDEPACYQCGGK